MFRMLCQPGRAALLRGRNASRTALVAVVMLAVSTAQAFTLVGPGAQARVVVDQKLPDCVWRAAQDLTNDVKKITGADLPLVRGGAVQPGDVHVAVKSDGRWESYSVREQGGVLEIAGSDARGAMFGVYDFIERYLGVDPMYFWSGVPHPKRAELSWEKVEIEQGEPSFRFRGWFLNDEDLLTKWREASGVRDYSQYRYYHDVVNHGAMEAVAEALVRARMNLIIPASFLNATRPAEEGLAAICAARGVFVSMHHIEPMGVSGYTFKDYWKQRGRDLEYSYFKYPREVEEVWRALATRWAKFPNVVWQIGLRGTGDRPMWADDPTMPKDDAGRARLITAALERQLAILDEVGVPREGRHVTTTLWGEGAYFHAKGLLKIPAGTTVVYSDNNCGWRWQRDLLDARPPADGERRGVYYHHQLIGMGPHLVSLVPAARTCAMLRGAREKGACDYAIFNMGNVREFVYGIDATAKMTWNIDAFDPETWTKAWIALQRRRVERRRQPPLQVPAAPSRDGRALLPRRPHAEPVQAARRRDQAPALRQGTPSTPARAVCERVQGEGRRRSVPRRACGHLSRLRLQPRHLHAPRGAARGLRADAAPRAARARGDGAGGASVRRGLRRLPRTADGRPHDGADGGDRRRGRAARRRPGRGGGASPSRRRRAP